MKKRTAKLLLSMLVAGHAVGAMAGEPPPDAAAPVVPAAAPESASDAVDLHADWTQFVSAAVAGDGDSAPRYGGRVDIYARIDAEKLGLWDGLAFNLQAETVYGRSTNRIGSSLLLPVNAALSVPANDDEAFDLSYSVIQKIGQVRIQAGKINLLDASAAIPIVAGGGKVGFSHIGLAAPPGLLASPKVLGAVVSAPVGGIVLNAGAWSPQNFTRRYGIGDAFDDGVNGWFAAVVPTRVGGRRGFHTFSIYLTNRRVNGREDYPDIRPPPGTSGLLPTKAGGTQLRYAVQQYLWQDPADPRRGWGFFGHVGVSTGAPGILDWSMTAGIAGTVPAAARPHDRFGIGYFRFSLADRLVDGLAPVLPVGDEQGGELYYTAQIGKRVAVTGYGQIVDPVIKGASTAVYLGLRVKTDF